MAENFVGRFLTRPWLPVLLAALAVLLVLPSAWTGWQLDDITHRYFLLGYPDFEGKTWSALELFSFLDGDTARTRAMMDLGLLPWWTIDGLRLSFWRPLTGLTHWVDYALWPDNAVLMHFQNLLWFGLLIACAALLYRRVLGPAWVAGLAALLYAVDDAHGLPAGWIAGRNTVLAALFGVVVLLVHDRWRRSGWRAGAVVGPICLALGLLSGEGALAVVAYLIAFSLFLDPAPRRERMLALAPYAVIVALWFAVYHLRGHGTWGSGFYVDPLAEPFAFLQALAHRGPILLLDQFGFPPSSIYLGLTTDQAALLWMVAMVVMVGLGILFFPLIRRDRTARFWLVGLLLSVPLICATLPSSRLLFFVGLGAMGLLAQWIGAFSERTLLPGNGIGRIPGRVVLVGLLFVHLVLAPLLLPLQSVSAKVGEPWLQHAARSIPDDPAMDGKDIIMVNPPVIFYANHTAAVRILNGDPLPQRLRALAPGSAELHVTRPDERTLMIRPVGGYLIHPFDNVFRGMIYPMGMGEEVHLTGMTVRVAGLTEDGRPDEVAFEFPVPLEDGSLMWLKWEQGRYVHFAPPPVGASVVLPAVQFEF